MFNIERFILDQYFPKKCLGCNSIGEWLCPSCRDNINIAPQATTLLSEHTNYKFMAFYGLMLDGVVRELIHNLKYNGLSCLAGEFVKIFQSDTGSQFSAVGRLFVESLNKDLEGGVLVPVPLSRKRIGERGYNQAECLAEAWSELLDLPVETGLLVKENRRSQVYKNREARMSGVQNAFQVKADLVNRLEKLVKDKQKIILVDDVLTTGATLISCVDALMTVVPKLEICGLVTARSLGR